MSDGGNFIMVPVPEERVTEVYAFLAAAPGTAKPSATKPSAPTESTDEELSQTWTDEEIRKAYRESTGNIRQVLDYLAARPGQRVPFPELHDEVGVTSQQFAGVMGGFGKRVHNRHGGKEWFFRYQTDPETGVGSYVMPEHAANVIRDEA